MHSGRGAEVEPDEFADNKLAGRVAGVGVVLFVSYEGVPDVAVCTQIGDVVYAVRVNVVPAGRELLRGIMETSKNSREWLKFAIVPPGTSS